MTAVLSNPGTGDVGGRPNRRSADRNMRQLLKDAGVGADARIARDGDRDEYGRYPYVVRRDRYAVTVDMPGLPLERVRFTNSPGQNVWRFPRLYVDGNSWLWEFATGWLRHGVRLPCKFDPEKGLTW